MAYQAIIGAVIPFQFLPGLATTIEYRFLGLAHRNYDVTAAAVPGAAVGGRLKFGNDFNHSLLIGVGSPALSVLFGLVLVYHLRERPGFTSMELLLMSSRLLSLVPHGLRVLCIMPTADHLTIEAGQSRCSADCPMCGAASLRVHSNYVRKLRDLPSHGKRCALPTWRFQP